MIKSYTSWPCDIVLNVPSRLLKCVECFRFYVSLLRNAAKGSETSIEGKRVGWEIAKDDYLAGIERPRKCRTMISRERSQLSPVDSVLFRGKARSEFFRPRPHTRRQHIMALKDNLSPGPGFSLRPGSPSLSIKYDQP